MGFGTNESPYSKSNFGISKVALKRFRSISPADLMPWRDAAISGCFPTFSGVLRIPSRAICTKLKTMCIIRSIEAL